MASEDDGILYCSVLRGDQVLSQYSSVDGNFWEFSHRVLEASDNLTRDKATYASGKSAFFPCACEAIFAFLFVSLQLHVALHARWCNNVSLHY